MLLGYTNLNITVIFVVGHNDIKVGGSLGGYYWEDMVDAIEVDDA